MKINYINFCLRFTVIVFITSVAISCKQNSDKKQKPNEDTDQRTEPELANTEAAHFSITLKALIKKDDQLQVFYLQDQSETYSPNQMLLKDVIGKDSYQDIVIDMPMGDYPLNFRLDLGINKGQGSISISECVLNYGNKSFKINGNDMKSYFILNDGVEMGSDSQTFKLKMYKVEGADKYDPFLVGNQKLHEVLIKNL